MQYLMGSILVIEPRCHIVAGENDRHTMVDAAYRAVLLCGEDTEAQHPIPDGIDSCHVEKLVTRQRKTVLALELIPFEEAGTRYDAPLADDAFLENVEGLSGLRPCVEDRMILRSIAPGI